MSLRTVFLTAAAASFALALLPANIALAQAPPTAPTAPAATQEQPAQPAKKGKKQTSKQEAESSMQSGTVPKRYMQSVPKEYHHLIPFSK